MRTVTRFHLPVQVQRGPLHLYIHFPHRPPDKPRARQTSRRSWSTFCSVGNPALAGLTRVRRTVEPTTRFAGLKGTTGSSAGERLIDNLVEQNAFPRCKLVVP